MQHVPTHVWLLSFSSEFSRSLHIVTSSRFPSFVWILLYCADKPLFLGCFIGWWTLGRFHLLTFVNNSAKHPPTSLWFESMFFSFYVCVSRNGIAVYSGNSVSFMDNSKLFSIAAAPHWLPSAVFHFSTSSLMLVSFCVFKILFVQCGFDLQVC